MHLSKLPLPFASIVVLMACGGSAPPPPVAPPPPPATSSAADPQPVGAAEEQGGSGPRARGDVQAELDRVDASLADIARRLQVAQDAAKVELQQQLAILQRRDDQLKAQLQTASGQADDDAAKVRREVHRAIVVLDGDMKKLEKQLAP